MLVALIMLFVYIVVITLGFYILYRVVKAAVRDGINESDFCNQDEDEA